MPDAPGFDDMPLFDMPAAPASVREAASRRRLRSRFLRTGPEAVDDRELLELLLPGHGAAQDAGDLAAALLDTFGTAPRDRAVVIVIHSADAATGTLHEQLTACRRCGYPADAMTAHPVSTLVNRAANEDPRCVEPIALI